MIGTRKTLMSPKKYRRMVFRKNIVIDFLLIGFGILSAALGLKGFILPNNFIDGGVTGISLLVALLTKNISFPILIVLFNIPFVIMGYFQMGRNFAIKTI